MRRFGDPPAGCIIYFMLSIVINLLIVILRISAQEVQNNSTLATTIHRFDFKAATTGKSSDTGKYDVYTSLNIRRVVFGKYAVWFTNNAPLIFIIYIYIIFVVCWFAALYRFRVIDPKLEGKLVLSLISNSNY